MSRLEPNNLSQIEFLNNLIELLWVISNKCSGDEFKRYSDQVFGEFKVSEAFLVAASEPGPDLEVVYHFQRCGSGKRLAYSSFKKDFTELLFDKMNNLKLGRGEDFLFLPNYGVPASYSWIKGDLVIFPTIFEQRLSACLILVFPIGEKNSILFEEVKSGIGNFKFLLKIVRSMCAWARYLKGAMDSEAFSFERRIGLMGLSLSAKQRRILELIALGEANKEIANVVNLSEHAVKYHVGNLLQKFDVSNRAELRLKVNQLNFFQDN